MKPNRPSYQMALSNWDVEMIAINAKDESYQPQGACRLTQGVSFGLRFLKKPVLTHCG